MGEMTDKTSVVYVGNPESEIKAAQFVYQWRVSEKNVDKGMRCLDSGWEHGVARKLSSGGMRM